jgi:hypothetical protein
MFMICPLVCERATITVARPDNFNDQYPGTRAVARPFCVIRSVIVMSSSRVTVASSTRREMRVDKTLSEWRVTESVGAVRLGET